MRGPLPEDVMLAVEVSDTTLRRDRQVKLVSEVEVDRSPAGDTYASIERKGLGGIVTIEALPGVTIAISQILG